jgi:hypothetical protein
MELVNIVSGYSIVSLLMFLFSMTILLNEFDCNCAPYGFQCLFVFQYALYDSVKDKLNLLGIIILETLVTLLTFGASVMMFIVGVIVWLFIMTWKLFYFCFKKR